METQTKKKIQLKHLAPYLPYGLMIKNWEENPVIMDCQYDDSKTMSIYNVIKGKGNAKPILRPLSDLTKDLEKGKRYCEILYTIENKPLRFFQLNTLWSSYATMQQLFEWHFDVFGLIEKGLAIDINKI